MTKNPTKISISAKTNLKMKREKHFGQVFCLKIMVFDLKNVQDTKNAEDMIQKASILMSDSKYKLGWFKKKSHWLTNEI